MYWLLLRKYGPVPVLPESAIDYNASYDDLSLPRNSYDECVEFISKEMLLAAQDLPYKRDIINIGRRPKELLWLFEPKHTCMPPAL